MEKPKELNRRQFLQGALASLATLAASGSDVIAQEPTPKMSAENYVPTAEDIRISEIMKAEFGKLEEREHEVTTLITGLENVMKEMTEVFLPDSQSERDRKEALVVEYKNIQDAEKTLRQNLESGSNETQALPVPSDSRSFLEGQYSRLLKKLDGLRSAYGLMKTML
jgi:hypothetical protein